MPTIPGTENLSPAIKYVIAFAIIFLLLTLFALILRRLTGARNSLSSERGRGRQPRLGIVDVYDLDRQRQLILLRRDNVEHLLLVGGPNDVVVETNIVRVPGARLPAAQTAEMVENGDAKPGRNGEGAAARPVIGGTLGPSDLLSTSGPETAALEPVLKPTRVQPAPPAPLPVRPVPARPAPRPAAPDEQDIAVPDMTRELEATLRRAQEPKPAQPAPPPPAAPVPVPQKAAEPVPPSTSPPAAPSRPAAPPRQEPPPRRDPPTPPTAPAGPPPRQEALSPPTAPPLPAPPSRPAPVAPLRPVPAPPPRQDAPRPEAKREEPAKQDNARKEPPRQEPPAPAAPPRQDAPRQDVQRAEPAPQDNARREPPRQEAPRQEPPRREPPRAPMPAPPPPKPAAAPAPAPAPKADPFSIEDIEAEFARLLGRPLDKKD